MEGIAAAKGVYKARGQNWMSARIVDCAPRASVQLGLPRCWALDAQASIGSLGLRRRKMAGFAATRISGAKSQL